MECAQAATTAEAETACRPTLDADGAYWMKQSDGANQHASNLAEWNQTYDQLSAVSFVGTVAEIWLDDIQIFRETTSQAVIQKGSPWRDSQVFGIPLAMERDGDFCDQPLTAFDIFSFGSGQGFLLRIPRRFDIAGIAITQSLWQRMAGTLERDTGMAVCLANPTIMHCASGFGELQSFLRGLFSTLDGDASALTHAPARKTMRSELLDHLQTSLQSTSSVPLPPPAYRVRKTIVEQARNYVLTHPSETVTITDLCENLGVSRRTLQYCFQEVSSTNPVQYLRAIRLNHVRHQLREGCATLIQDVASRWEFWHLSRFANDYREMFGELPSETLRRARAQ